MQSFEFYDRRFYLPVFCLTLLFGIFPRLPTSVFEEIGMLSKISRFHPEAGFQRALAIELQPAEFVA